MEYQRNTISIVTVIIALCQTVTAFQRPGPTNIPAVPEEKYFLSILNGYRQLVREGEIQGQPMAIHLPDLRWDNELAEKAKKWAENCVYEHEKPQITGEVHGYTVDAKKEPLHASFDGYKEFEYGKVVYGLSHHLHYTQIVWEKSTSVGCWRQSCPKLKTAWKPVNNAYFTVCKFNPRGNIIGEVPYRYREPTKWELPVEPGLPFERPGVPGKPHLDTTSVLLDLHNGYRKLLREGKIPGQPRALKLPDFELKRTSLYAISGRVNECSMLNLARNTDYNEFVTHTIDPYRSHFHDFFDEYKKFTYGRLGPGWESTAKYTQMAWANTTEIVCKTKICYPLRLLDGQYIDAAFSVCWYFPKGNILGEYPYEEFDEYSTTTLGAYDW